MREKYPEKFGHEAVETEDRRVESLLEQDRHTRDAEFLEPHSEKFDPKHLNIRDRIYWKRRGELAPKNVTAYLDQHLTDINRSQLTDKPGRIYDAYMNARRYEAKAQENFESASEAGKEKLDVYRERLASLDFDQQAIVDVYFEQNAPQFLKDSYRSSTAEVSWSRWMANEASDEQFLNFLQWHNHRMEELNSNPEIRERIDEYIAYQGFAFISASQKGILPQEAVPGALKRLENLEVRVGDIFSTTIDGSQGYHDVYAGNQIVVSERLDPHTFFHEANHASLGVAFPGWLNEAITETIAMGVTDGDFENFLPYKREQDLGVYEPERQLLGVLIELSNGKISPKDILEVYCGNMEEYTLLSSDDRVSAYQLKNKIATEQIGALKDIFTEAYDGFDMFGFVEERLRAHIENEAKTFGNEPMTAHRERLLQDFALRYTARDVHIKTLQLMGASKEYIDQHLEDISKGYGANSPAHMLPA